MRTTPGKLFRADELTDLPRLFAEESTRTADRQQRLAALIQPPAQKEHQAAPARRKRTVAKVTPVAATETQK
jgi:hypothetical protein